MPHSDKLPRHIFLMMMFTTLDMARAEFGFYAAHIALYNGEIEPLHGHTFHVTLRVSGEPDARGMVPRSTKSGPAMRNAVAPLRCRTLVPGQAPELRITPRNDSVSII
jgi:6-pyruvoyl-tetrahydropterin synthase